MNDTELFPRSEGIIFASLFIFESLAIAIGNLFTIVAFLSDRQLRKQKFYLVINLAVSDFVVGTVAVPWWTYDLAEKFDLWYHGRNHLALIFREALSLSVISASLLGLVMVSLERMYAILWPLKHHVIEAKTYRKVIGINWSLSIFLPSVNLARRNELLSFETYRHISTSFWSCLLLIMCASYTSIWIKIKFGQPPPHHAPTLQDRKITLSLFIVTAVSIVTMLPYRIVHSEQFIFPSDIMYRRTYNTVILLLYANSLVNPIIYSLRMAPFRQAVAKRLLVRRSKRNPAPSELKILKRPSLKRENLQNHTTTLGTL